MSGGAALVMTSSDQNHPSSLSSSSPSTSVPIAVPIPFLSSLTRSKTNPKRSEPRETKHYSTRRRHERFRQSRSRVQCEDADSSSSSSSLSSVDSSVNIAQAATPPSCTRLHPVSGVWRPYSSRDVVEQKPSKRHQHGEEVAGRAGSDEEDSSMASDESDSDSSSSSPSSSSSSSYSDAGEFLEEYVHGNEQYMNSKSDIDRETCVSSDSSSETGRCSSSSTADAPIVPLPAVACDVATKRESDGMNAAQHPVSHRSQSQRRRLKRHNEDHSLTPPPVCFDTIDPLPTPSTTGGRWGSLIDNHKGRVSPSSFAAFTGRRDRSSSISPTMPPASRYTPSSLEQLLCLDLPLSSTPSAIPSSETPHNRCDGGAAKSVAGESWKHANGRESKRRRILLTNADSGEPALSLVPRMSTRMDSGSPAYTVASGGDSPSNRTKSARKTVSSALSTQRSSSAVSHAGSSVPVTATPVLATSVPGASPYPAIPIPASVSLLPPPSLLPWSPSYLRTPLEHRDTVSIISLIQHLYDQPGEEFGHRTYGHCCVTKEEAVAAASARQDLLYGEVLAVGATRMFDRDHLDLRSAKSMVDLGSGLGKLCIQAFVQFPNLERVVGCELAQSRFNKTVEAVTKLHQTMSLWKEERKKVMHGNNRRHGRGGMTDEGMVGGQMMADIGFAHDFVAHDEEKASHECDVMVESWGSCSDSMEDGEEETDEDEEKKESSECSRHLARYSSSHPHRRVQLPHLDLCIESSPSTSHPSLVRYMESLHPHAPLSSSYGPGGVRAPFALASRSRLSASLDPHWHSLQCLHTFLTRHEQQSNSNSSSRTHSSDDGGDGDSSGSSGDGSSRANNTRSTQIDSESCLQYWNELQQRVLCGSSATGSMTSPLLTPLKPTALLSSPTCSRTLELRQCNLFEMEEAKTADVVICETKFNEDSYPALCSFLREMKSGCRLLTYEHLDTCFHRVFPLDARAEEQRADERHDHERDRSDRMHLSGESTEDNDAPDLHATSCSSTSSRKKSQTLSTAHAHLHSLSPSASTPSKLRSTTSNESTGSATSRSRDRDRDTSSKRKRGREVESPTASNDRLADHDPPSETAQPQPALSHPLTRHPIPTSSSTSSATGTSTSTGSASLPPPHPLNPFKQMNINMSKNDRFYTSWATNAGHHFFLWIKE